MIDYKFCGNYCCISDDDANNKHYSSNEPKYIIICIFGFFVSIASSVQSRSNELYPFGVPSGCPERPRPLSFYFNVILTEKISDEFLVSAIVSRMILSDFLQLLDAACESTGHDNVSSRHVEFQNYFTLIIIAELSSFH